MVQDAGLVLVFDAVSRQGSGNCVDIVSLGQHADPQRHVRATRCAARVYAV